MADQINRPTISTVTAVWSTAYLNKAMMHFGNNEVVPVYYTTFTIASVAAGGLVYSEFSCLIDPVTEELDTVHALLFGFGCLLLFLGVYLVSSVSTPSSYPYPRLLG